MKKPEVITFTAQPDGTFTVSVAGHPGPDCTILTRDIIAALGKVQDVRLTEEHHRRVQSDNAQRVGRS